MMIALPAKSTRVAFVSGLLLVLLVLLVLALASTYAHLGSTPLLQDHLSIAGNGSGGPGVP